MPAKIPWLVPRDLDFEFHQQWGPRHPNPTLTDTLTRTLTRTLTLTLPLIPTRWGHATHEHMVDELAKYYALPWGRVRVRARTPFFKPEPQPEPGTTLCPPSRCVTSCGTG